MLKRFFKKVNNKAFTLIEILLAIGLLAIATISIGSMIVSTQNNTAKMLNENELQQQLVEAQETFHNEILSTSAGIKYWTRAAKADDWTLTFKDNNTEGEKVIAFYNLDQQDYVLTKTYYWYDLKAQTLKIGELTQELPKNRDDNQVVPVDNNLQESLDQVVSWSLVSSNMELFTVDLEDYVKNRLISFEMMISQEGSEYPTDDTIYMRNEISINTDLNIEKYHNLKITIPTLSEDTINFAYDGEEHSPTEVNFLNRFVTRSEDSILVATDVGVYTITYRLKDKTTTTWSDGTTRDITYTWRISKRQVTLTWGQTEWIYDGSKHSTVVEIGNVQEGDSVNIIYSNNSVGPNIGEVTCTVSVDNPNYTVPPNNTAVLRIKKQQATAEIDIVNRTYNGEYQSMVNVKRVTGGTIKWYIGTVKQMPNSSTVNASSCTTRDAGTYHIYYKIVADGSGNYSGTEVTYLGQAIMSRLATAKYHTVNHEYDGNEKIGVVGDFIVPGGAWKATDAGTHTATVEPDKNHLWADGSGASKKTVTWEITRAPGSIVAPSAIPNLVYTGSPLTLVYKGQTPYGKVMYKVGSGSWSESLPQATDAGTYTVYYYSTGDANHEPTSQSASITVKIAKKPAATISTSDKSYTGSQQNGYVGNQHVSLSGKYAATAAGTYEFTATPDANYCWKGTADDSAPRKFTWTISKVATQYNPPIGLDLTYNGNNQVLIKAGTTDHGVMMYRVGASGSFKETLPVGKDAGTYTVYFYVKGDSNHEDSPVESINVVIKRSPTAKYSFTNHTYDGTEKTGASGTNVTVSGTPKATGAGTYTAKVTPTSNYAWEDGTYGAVERQWTINKASGAFGTKPTAKDLTYTGDAQTLLNKGTSSTGTYKYRIKGTTTWYTSIPTGTNAGEYVVEYYVDGDGNHNDTSVSEIKVTIKRSPTASLTGTDKTYNGSEQTGATGSHVSWTSGTRKATNVGTYTAKAKPADNYAWSDGTTGEKSVTWKIKEAAATKTNPTAKTNLVYNESDQVLINAGSSSHGTFSYTLGSTTTSSASSIKGKNAQTYTVTWKFTGDANHKDETGTLTITIARAKTATASGKDYTYDGGSKTGATGSYVSWTGTRTASSVGTHTAYATPDSNHAWSNGGTEQRTVTWKINRNNSCSVTTKNRTYTGNSQNGYSASAGQMDWSGTASATNAGNYTFYCKPKSGYGWSDTGGTEQRTFTWTMSPKATEYVTTANRTYSGSRQKGFSASSSNLTWSGDSSATNAGSYTFYCTPKANYAWKDGTTGQKTFTWTMNRLNTASIWSNGDRAYDGNTYVGAGSTNAYWYSGSEASQVNPGTYTCWFQPNANYAWSDGTYGGKSVTFTITGHIWKVGDPCRVNSGAKFSNGSYPASLVFSTQYYVLKINGDYITIGPSKTAGYVSSNITGTMHKNYLRYGTS